MSTQQKLGKLTGILRDTLAHVHCLAVFAECLAGVLACRDQRQCRPMGSGNALEARHDDALYKYTFSLLHIPCCHLTALCMVTMQMYAQSLHC